MASPIAHSFLAISLTCIADRWIRSRRPFVLFMIAMWIAVLPDLDLIFVVFSGVPGQIHRAFSHSLLFGFVFSFVFGFFYVYSEPDFKSGQKVFILIGFFWVLYASHLVLDLFTADFTQPYGIQIFLPWSGESFISPVCFLDGLDYGLSKSDFLTERNAGAIIREIIIFVPQSLLFLSVGRAARKSNVSTVG